MKDFITKKAQHTDCMQNTFTRENSTIRRKVQNNLFTGYKSLIIRMEEHIHIS